MTINDFLVYLTGLGVVAVISWLFEGWNWYQNLIGRTKQVVFYLACVAVAIGAQLVIAFVPGAIIAMLSPYFAIAAGLFVYVFVGTGFHSTTKLSRTARVSAPPKPVEEAEDPATPLEP